MLHLCRFLLHQIILQNKRATGVKMTKEGVEYKIKARKEVILSAGSVQSPQLLMLSGIGPKEHLESLGVSTCTGNRKGVWLSPTRFQMTSFG